MALDENKVKELIYSFASVYAQIIGAVFVYTLLESITTTRYALNYWTIFFEFSGGLLLIFIILYFIVALILARK